MGFVTGFAIAEPTWSDSGIPNYFADSNANPNDGFAIFSTVISQYSNSPILIQLIQNLAAYFDNTPFFDNFYQSIWNIETAQGYGLDVWGRIVGVGRVITIPESNLYIGFEGQTGIENFNNGIWYNDDPSSNNYILSDSVYRRIILAKAAFNICKGSVISINAILSTVFNEYGNVYIQDNGNMTMGVVFSSPPSAVDYAIATQANIIPRPSGVSLTIIS